MLTEERTLHVSDTIGDVSALLVRPRDAWAAYVFAHGAGAGMRHPFMDSMALALRDAGVATLRYQFPYMEQRTHRPDPPARLEQTVATAVERARAEFDALPLFAGGKSMGGRMSSQAASRGALPEVSGLVFLGFPLHPPKRPGVSRAAHLQEVVQPMLFVQGTRDELATMELMRGVCDSLGKRATLHIVEDGDHSFNVLKRTGREPAEVLTDIRDAITQWMRRVIGGTQ